MRQRASPVIRYSVVKNKMHIVLGLLLPIFLILSCDRKEFKSYKGDYECQLAVRKWVNGGLNEYTISPGQLIEVSKEKKEVYILGHYIHIDSIEPNYPFEWEENNKFYSLLFFNDSLRFEETIFNETDTNFSYIYVGGKIE